MSAMASAHVSGSLLTSRKKYANKRRVRKRESSLSRLGAHASSSSPSAHHNHHQQQQQPSDVHLNQQHDGAHHWNPNHPNNPSHSARNVAARATTIRSSTQQSGFEDYSSTQMRNGTVSPSMEAKQAEARAREYENAMAREQLQSKRQRQAEERARAFAEAKGLQNAPHVQMPQTAFSSPPPPSPPPPPPPPAPPTPPQQTADDAVARAEANAKARFELEARRKQEAEARARAYAEAKGAATSAHAPTPAAPPPSPPSPAPPSPPSASKPTGANRTLSRSGHVVSVEEAQAEARAIRAEAHFERHQQTAASPPPPPPPSPPPPPPPPPPSPPRTSRQQDMEARARAYAEAKAAPAPPAQHIAGAGSETDTFAAAITKANTQAQPVSTEQMQARDELMMKRQKEADERAREFMAIKIEQSMTSAAMTKEKAEDEAIVMAGERIRAEERAEAASAKVKMLKQEAANAATARAMAEQRAANAAAEIANAEAYKAATARQEAEEAAAFARAAIARAEAEAAAAAAKAKMFEDEAAQAARMRADSEALAKAQADLKDLEDVRERRNGEVEMRKHSYLAAKEELKIATDWQAQCRAAEKAASAEAQSEVRGAVSQYMLKVPKFKPIDAATAAAAAESNANAIAKMQGAAAASIARTQADDRLATANARMAAEGEALSKAEADVTALEWIRARRQQDVEDKMRAVNRTEHLLHADDVKERAQAAVKEARAEMDDTPKLKAASEPTKPFWEKHAETLREFASPTGAGLVTAAGLCAVFVMRKVLTGV